MCFCGKDSVSVHPVGISLTKTPSPTDIPNGVSTPVLFTYVITNTGDFFPASGTLVDDNGTPGNTSDDFTVCAWGPIAKGASQSCTATLNLNLPGTDTLRSRTNKAIASGTSGGAPVKDSATATVRGHDRSISLTKTPDKNQIQDGVATPVLYTYVICNTGKFFPASGTLVDDAGTQGNTSDDVTVGSWGPLAPGACTTLTHTFTISHTTKNVAVASGASGSATVSAKDSANVPAIPCGCTLGYPFTSSNPRTSVVFNESEVLRAFDPTANCATTGGTIKMWYNDEHALTLGVRRIIVKTASGTTTTDYPLTPTPVSPIRVDNPLVGDVIASGDQRGTDPMDRPMYPALFLTDITADPNSRAGDWQFNGTGIAPTAVAGVWKGAVVTVNKTVTPNTRITTPDADPAKNNYNLGAGSDPAPAGLTNQGYGAECIWSIDSMVAHGQMIPGHVYRCQFIVHDGDQNKVGGDCGQGCTKAAIPGPSNIPKAGMKQGGNEAQSVLPAEYSLAQTYPNPFNPSTELRFNLPEASVVKLTVYNILGQEVATLVNGVVEAGFQSVTWNTENSGGKSFASGVYLYRMKATSVKSAQQFTDFKKMVLIK